MENKTRHGCVTAWLILMIIGAVLGLYGAFMGNALMESMAAMAPEGSEMEIPEVPGWVGPVRGVVAILNIVFVIMLFKWKKMGFYGIVATSVIGVILAAMQGAGMVMALIGAVIGLGILYGVYQIKKDDVTGWSQLE